MNVYIWLDDERPMPALLPFDWGYRIHAKTYLEALHYLQYYCKSGEYCVYMDFDHDLGEGKSGYDVAKWIVENNIQNIWYRVHSMNPVGRANIEQLLDHYGYKRFQGGRIGMELNKKVDELTLDDGYVWIMVDNKKRYAGSFTNKECAECARYTYERLFPNNAPFVVACDYPLMYWDEDSMLAEAGIKVEEEE